MKDSEVIIGVFFEPYTTCFNALFGDEDSSATTIDNGRHYCLSEIPASILHRYCANSIVMKVLVSKLR